MRHLVNFVHDLTGRGVGLKVLAGQGASLDTTTANGRLVFGIFAVLAEFERELIVDLNDPLICLDEQAMEFAGL